MSFAAYPEYKDSGIAWLEQVPAHWKLTRLKRACEVFPSNVDKKSHDDEPAVLLCNYTDVYYNDKIVEGMEFMAATATPEQIERFSLRAGDTIITKDSETADDIAIAAYVPQDLPGVICGYHLSMVRPRSGMHGAFVKRLFDSTYAKSRFAVLANGLTRVGLGQYAVDNVEFAVPPLVEQQKIATFLDRETAKIDSLVAEQQRLIALLKEKRQAVISFAVTKGLDPSAPMKDSGVAWLGLVPAHWTLRPIKHLVQMQSGGTPSKANPDFWDGEIPWASAKDMKVDLLVDTEDHITASALAAGAASLTPPNALAVVVRGMILAHTFPVAQLARPLSINQDLKALIPCDAITPGYLAWTLRGLSRETLDRVSEAGHGTCALRMEDWVSMALPVPPLSEQAEIENHILASLNQLETLRSEAHSSIALLRERRTALVSAAVTGKIDVRNTVVEEAA